MENMELCQQCDEQPSNDMPHEVLREIREDAIKSLHMR
jgi:hypothetical protein